VVVARIALVRGAQALDGIVVIVDSGTAVVAAAGPVKLRTQVLGWARDFRASFHAHAAGESSGDQHGFAAPGHSFKLYHAFIHVDFSKAAAVNLDIKFGPAH
jgi:hypothetical protein